MTHIGHVVRNNQVVLGVYGGLYGRLSREPPIETGSIAKGKCHLSVEKAVEMSVR